MQCSNCKFENIPGQQQCTRCGAMLIHAKRIKAEELSPPRPGMFAFMRPLFFMANRITDKIRMPGWLLRWVEGNDDGLPSESRAALVLSVIPGLGHLVSRRFAAAAIVFVVWMLGLLIVLNCYVGNAGSMLGGLLLSLHISVMFDAARIQQNVPGILGRLRIMIVLLIVIGSIYFFAERMFHRSFSFVVSPYTSEMAKIQQDDVLIFPNIKPASLKCGDVVYVRTRDHRLLVVTDRRYPFDAYVYGGESVRFIIGVSGDKITASPDGVSINEKRMERAALFSAGIIVLPEKEFKCELKEDEVLAVVPIANQLDQRIKVPPEIWKMIYVLNISDVQSKASGVYWPFSHKKTF